MFEIQYSNQKCFSTAVVFAKECWVNNLQGSKYTTVLREHSSASDSYPSAGIQPFPQFLLLEENGKSNLSFQSLLKIKHPELCSSLISGC